MRSTTEPIFIYIYIEYCNAHRRREGSKSVRPSALTESRSVVVEKYCLAIVVELGMVWFMAWWWWFYEGHKVRCVTAMCHEERRLPTNYTHTVEDAT